MLSRSVTFIACRRLALPIVLGLAAIFAALLGVRAARADVAPFPAQAGTSLGSASTTNIQMISETVLLSVETLSSSADSTYQAAQVGARVVADFTLVNPSSSTSSLLVGFPLDVPAKSQDAGGYIKLSNLRAFVAGQEMTTQLQSVGSDTWSAWQMSFGPGATRVQVTYDLPATVDACSTELGYVLHTGAAWAGPIGRADLIVRFPYAAESTFVSPQGIYLGPSTSGFQVEGTDLHWHYDNLEPTPANDLAVTFVKPECWLTVAAARAAVNQHTSAENYWHLASAYAAIVFPHHGFYSPLIAQVADAQYQKALALDPQNPAINAEYAEYLVYQFGGPLLPSDQQTELNQQCAKALALSPTDADLQATCGSFVTPVEPTEILDTPAPAEPTGTVAAPLTASPRPTIAASPTAISSSTPPATLTALPLPAASSTPIAVAQVSPAPSPTPIATPPPQPNANSLPTAITLAVIVLALITAGVFYLRRQGRR